MGDFPGGPVVKNLHASARDPGLIPGQGTKIPGAVGQLSPRITTKTQGRQINNLLQKERWIGASASTHGKPLIHSTVNQLHGTERQEVEEGELESKKSKLTS